MKSLISKFKQWWNNPCFWSHDNKIVASEERALAYKCQRCGRVRLQTF